MLTTEETVAHMQGPEVRFERIGPTGLKGLAEPLTLYRAAPAVRSPPPGPE